MRMSSRGLSSLKLFAQPLRQLFEASLVGFLFWSVVTVFVGVSTWFILQLPSLKDVQSRVSFQMAQGEQKVLRVLEPSKKNFVHWKKLPLHVAGAILVSEDSTFFHHRGIDWFELGQAFRKNFEEKRFARGASTITQQVVKNLFLTPEKNLSRKLIEGVTALRLERVLTKDEILDYYLNLVELGPGIYGLGEGADYYFGKDPKDLTPYESAVLAFLLPQPRVYGPDFKRGKPSSFRDERVRAILSQMVRQKYLDPSWNVAEKDAEDSVDEGLPEESVSEEYESEVDESNDSTDPVEPESQP